MKLIIYYLSLLLFVALLTGFIISQTSSTETMSMTTIFSICGALAIYVTAMSLVGEVKTEDERELHHRRVANRAGLIVGSSIITLAIFWQLLAHKQLDYWLLASLIGINLTKIVSLIYLNYRK